jgi:hypothetical protein
MLSLSHVEDEKININPPKRNKFHEKENNKSSTYISIFLIKNIMTYIEPRLIIKNCLFLNKAIHKLFQFKILEKNIKTEYLMKGKQDMNEIYVEYDIEIMLEKSNINNQMLLNIEFEIESKDQGWACLNNSNSWIELKIIEKNSEKKHGKELGIYDLVKNFKESDYKNTKISLNHFSPNGNFILDFIKKHKCFIQIIARSMYPGWLCYVRRVNASFTFFEINLA